MMLYMYRSQIESIIIRQTNHRIGVLVKRHPGIGVTIIVLAIPAMRRLIQAHLQHILCMMEIRFIILEMDILTATQVQSGNPV